MKQGQTYAPTITLRLSGPANGKLSYCGWDYSDTAPRFAFAYSPNFSSGLLRDLYGPPEHLPYEAATEFTTTILARP
jgi:hypothetical protein